MLDKLYVAEYSVIQKCGHICTIAEMLNANLGISMRKEKNDYKPIFISENIDDCNKVLEALYKNLDGELPY